MIEYSSLDRPTVFFTYDLDEYLAWANLALKKNDCVICVHGHHHIPGIWDVENGIVASPGEWMKNPAFLQMEKGGIKLKSI